MTLVERERNEVKGSLDCMVAVASSFVAGPPPAHAHYAHNRGLLWLFAFRPFVRSFEGGEPHAKTHTQARDHFPFLLLGLDTHTPAPMGGFPLSTIIHAVLNPILQHSV